MQGSRIAIALLVAMIVGWLRSPLSGAQEATPILTSCEDVAEARHAAMVDRPEMAMGTPMPGRRQMAMAIDQMYIDMMIPHHASIIAMAEAALPRLTDERLKEIAQAIVATQAPEIAELRRNRAAWYSAAEPMPMDMMTMAEMADAMPGMSGTMEEMAFQMDIAGQVAAICSAENSDLVFIDLTIPHHQMAIDASQAIGDKAVHPELRAFAQQVIDAQQREIDELTTIRQEIAAQATPMP
jgi:uncharacterized protein (DUF305 family)